MLLFKLRINREFCDAAVIFFSLLAAKNLQPYNDKWFSCV